MQNRLFFIYVAKNEEWKKRQEEDWDYVSSMARFFKWWIRHEFNEDYSVDADILPVISGKIFDRMSLAYLLRDHRDRGDSTFHFYLTDFKPLWTDCRFEGYHSDSFGLTLWSRPKVFSSDPEKNNRYFADNNCSKISHVLSHEILRRQTKKRKTYFDQVHKLWDLHTRGSVPFLYYNSRFNRVTKNSEYKFVTIDIEKL